MCIFFALIIIRIVQKQTNVAEIYGFVRKDIMFFRKAVLPYIKKIEIFCQSCSKIQIFLHIPIVIASDNKNYWTLTMDKKNDKIAGHSGGCFLLEPQVKKPTNCR